MKTYNILVLADLHVGSKTALLHPDTPGYTFHNVGQEYLWECWQHMVSELPKSIDYLILLDEMVNGPAGNGKKRFSTLITDVREQINGAKLLLDMVIWREAPSGRRVRRCKEVWCLIGSDWHVDELGAATDALGESIGAEQWKTKRYSGYNLFLNFDGMVLDYAHSQSVVMVNRAMPLEREIRYRLVDNPVPKRMRNTTEIRGIYRAHAHQANKYEDRHAESASCPSWQLPYYDFGVAKRSMARAVFDIGWMFTTVKLDRLPPLITHIERYDNPESAIYDAVKGEWLT